MTKFYTRRKEITLIYDKYTIERVYYKEGEKKMSCELSKKVRFTVCA